jgi:hypothetical protein
MKKFKEFGAKLQKCIAELEGIYQTLNSSSKILKHLVSSYLDYARINAGLF